MHVPGAASPATPGLRFRDMRLKVGDRVQIEPPSQTGVARATAKVVGWVEGHSLILTVPSAASGRVCLQAGEAVIVRAFTGRSAFAFSCSVRRSVTRASDFLLLSFPDTIDAVDVRSSPRFRVGLAAHVTTAGGPAPFPATIDDLSATGARIVCDSPLGDVGDELRVAFGFVLHDVPVKLALRAAIRTVDETEPLRYRHGVAFVEPSDNDRLVLAAFVWFNMYENPKLSA